MKGYLHPANLNVNLNELQDYATEWIWGNLLLTRMGSLVLGLITEAFDDFIQSAGHRIYEFLTVWLGNLFPFFKTILPSYLGIWRIPLLNPNLQTVPTIFNWIKVRVHGWPHHNPNLPPIEIFRCDPRRMFRVVICKRIHSFRNKFRNFQIRNESCSVVVNVASNKILGKVRLERDNCD